MTYTEFSNPKDCDKKLNCCSTGCIESQPLALSRQKYEISIPAFWEKYEILRKSLNIVNGSSVDCNFEILKANNFLSFCLILIKFTTKFIVFQDLPSQETLFSNLAFSFTLTYHTCVLAEFQSV